MARTSLVPQASGALGTKHKKCISSERLGEKKKPTTTSWGSFLWWLFLRSWRPWLPLGTLKQNRTKHQIIVCRGHRPRREQSMCCTNTWCTPQGETHVRGSPQATDWSLGSGQGIRPGGPRSLPPRRLWDASGDWQEPREQATLSSVDGS